MVKFHHFGVPSATVYEGATYVEDAKVHVTEPDEHPFHVEFLRCEEGCTMPDVVQTQSHIAFLVDDLAAALEGKNIIIEPFEAKGTLRCAFIQDGDAIIELMEEL